MTAVSVDTGARGLIRAGWPTLDQPLIGVGFLIISENALAPFDQFRSNGYLRLSDRTFGAVPLDGLKTCVENQLFEGFPCEELDVGSVEETHLGILEIPGQERESNVCMSKVWNAEDDAARSVNQLGSLPKAAQWILEVFQDVGCQNYVEALPRQRGECGRVVEVADDYLNGHLLEPFKGRRVNFHCCHRKVPRIHDFGHQADRCAQFQNGFGRPDQVQEAGTGIPVISQVDW